MSYTIVSGQFETGTKEQQLGYMQLFGEENIQHKFDLYFHWYNIIHETGHCLKSETDIKMSDVQEEMFVNEFAISYYRFVGEDEKLVELQNLLQSVINGLPTVVPAGETFTGFYERIWNTEQINNVMIYGYFQLNSVLQAMKKQRTFEEVLSDLGIHIIRGKQILRCTEEISSENRKHSFHSTGKHESDGD